MHIVVLRFCKNTKSSLIKYQLKKRAQQWAIMINSHNLFVNIQNTKQVFIIIHNCTYLLVRFYQYLGFLGRCFLYFVVVLEMFISLYEYVAIIRTQ